MGASAARALLAARCAAVPALLQSLLAEESPAGPAAGRPDLRFAGQSGSSLRFVTTGIGTSEGPARLLAHLLREHAGAAARFVPLSALVGAALAPVGDGADAALVVFSQGLSPNAQLALAQAGRFAALLVYTSVPAAHPQVRALTRSGAVVTVLPPVGPPGEDRLFLRVLGPAAAQLAAAQLADAVAARRGGGARLPLGAAVQAALAAPARARQALAALAQGLVARGQLSEDALATYGLGALWRAQPEPTLAFVTSGGYGELGLGLRWKFLEGAGLSEPLAWDILQVAHGPFQQTFQRPLFLCALTRGDSPVEQALLGRLQAMLPPHHVFLQLPAEPPGPLALFSHDLACNELLLAVLRGRDWDLFDWPGRCCDGPLYELADGADLLAAPAGSE